MSERDQRTEKPTQQRLKKAREEGKFPSSREFISGIQFAVFVAILLGTSGEWSDALARGARSLLHAAFASSVSISSVQRMAWGLFAAWFVPLALSGLAMVAMALGAQLAMTGFGLAPSKLTPEFSRLDPLAKLKDLPRRNFGSLVEALICLLVLAYTGWKVCSSYTTEFYELPYRPLGSAVGFTGSTFRAVFRTAAGLLFVWGVTDLLRQKKRYADQLKMTKQEIKEEWKQTEGSPEIKLRIRRLRNELARRRMMADVPKATAVIVNPTHFAVALRYEHMVTAAPKVLAKGKNLLALRIRETARKHQVPIIENPPLAQALYKNCDVGQEIPANLYKAVAEVLAYVLRVMNKGAA